MTKITKIDDQAMQIKEGVSIIDFNFISKREITVADEGQVMRLTVITSVEIMSVSNDLIFSFEILKICP